MKIAEITEFNRLFDQIESKQKTFHFGYRTWDDVRADTLAHVCNKYHLYDPAQPFGGWVYRVIKNQVMNRMRNSCYANTLENKAFSEHPSIRSLISQINNDPIEDYESKERLENLRYIIKEVWQQLTFFEKKILIARFKRGLRRDKLGDRLGYSGKHINVVIKRLLVKINNIALNNNFHIRGIKKIER